jgi:hypothetical protein
MLCMATKKIRYMQDQPHLVDLGLARLELFKEFPLASLQQQTSNNYVWVIRTDPNLNETLKENLIDSLEHNNNSAQRRFLLVASNDNPNIQTYSLLELEPSSIWSGSHDEFTNYLSLAKSSGSVVLESRLDADDALHKDFVQTVQDNAISYFTSKETEASWKVWCASRHVEWQYRAMWETESPEIGALLSIKDSDCISTGLTIGYAATRDFQTHRLPRMKHDQLAYTVPSCRKKHNNNKKECLDFVNLVPTALRARTPTSAGMMNILLNKKDGTANRKYEKAGAGDQVGVQPRLWQIVEKAFGFSEEGARRVHSHLERNMRTIAEDNLKGQCTTGHSCKESSKLMLQTIIEHPEYL